MSSFLEYSVMSGDSGSCSVRGFQSDHGITTFQACGASVSSCGTDDHFMASRTSPDSIPHQPGSYQSTSGSLGLSYGAHPACASSYGGQSFCATYNHYTLNQEVDSPTAFPQCGPLLYSGNISSSVVSQHRHGYSAAPLGQLQYPHAAYGGGHEQAGPYPGASNPLSPLHAAHLEACCSPLSEGTSAQTFDWMKVKRNPPKTVAAVSGLWRATETTAGRWVQFSSSTHGPGE
ncbi:unnamed protein product [Menidia menidia]|uniref:(Atlantic silverside) hypothetical protein n=1 Tax=Menidia menidia TaxID=238744 RepID=A0A8S4AU81_9TELE|nr:unnamed protein product [Menidia menidia]